MDNNMEASLNKDLSTGLPLLRLSCKPDKSKTYEFSGPANPVLSPEADGEGHTLLTLPAEIQLGILDFITLPTDLKSLCLTCKALHNDATIRLYHKIGLPVHVLNEVLVKSLNTHNQGLAHVRFFEIHDSGVHDYDQASHGRYLLRILLALPRDALTAIWINTTSGVSSCINETIVQRQRRLLNFVSHASGDLGIMPYTLPQNRLVNITSFAVHLESTDDIVRYLGNFSQMSNLTSLNITIHYWNEAVTVSSDDVLRLLLHGNAQSPGVKAKLTTLFLTGFNFETCAHDLLDFLHANLILHLAFSDCTDTWKLYQRAAKKPLNLLSFIDEESKYPEDREGEATYFDSFLRGFRGLRELKLTYGPAYVEEWEDCIGVA